METFLTSGHETREAEEELVVGRWWWMVVGIGLKSPPAVTRRN